MPINHSRRTALRLATMAGLGAGIAQSPWFTEVGMGQAPVGTKRDIMPRPVIVPPDFVGMHFHRWPQGTPLSPPPTYSFGTVRSHDYGVAWNDIHLGPQQFNWSRLDTWVQTHASRGRTLIYTVYGTPSWASSMPTIKDAYGHLGAAAPPKDLNVLAQFIQALVMRYNMAGKRQIQFVEIWNEPHFLQNKEGFWWGTPSQLASVGRTIYTSAKSVDPGIRILSPAFDGLAQGHYSANATGMAAGLRQYIQAPDGAGTAGGQWFDGFAVHTYNADILDPSHGLEGTMQQVSETLRNFNLPVPVYTTETGYTENSPFQKLGPPDQAKLLRRQAAVQAALGVKAVCFYSHDDPFCGNPSKNPIISQAINDIATKLAGQTLEQVSVVPGGQVLVGTQAGGFAW